jgi:hypothetical protein
MGRRCIIELSCSGMSACLAAASVTHECALEICEPSCVPRAAKHLFILVVHSPLGAVGYMVAPELTLARRRGWGRGTRGSTGAHLGKEARFGVAGHVVALEPGNR